MKKILERGDLLFKKNLTKVKLTLITKTLKWGELLSYEKNH